MIGLDGGGTQTRAICATVDGHVLGYGEASGANPEHNSGGRDAVRAAIDVALTTAKLRPNQVAACVAGLAGLNSARDQPWADETISMGFARSRAVNDAEVALAGAFLLEPGVVAICGTGSTVVGLTRDGVLLRSDWYHHWAGAARTLGFRALQEVAREATAPEDRELVDATLAEWGAADANELRARLRDLRDEPEEVTKRRAGGLAPQVTRLASRSPLAARLCDELAGELARGIELVCRDLVSTERRVSLVGSVARTPAISSRVAALLDGVVLQEPALSPVAGAVLMAIRELGLTIDDGVVGRLAVPA